MRTRMYGVVRGGRRNPTPYSIQLSIGTTLCQGNKGNCLPMVERMAQIRDKLYRTVL